jgi:hypothetical protein
MVTQQEVRRAISWVDKYVLGLISYVDWGGKTYALIKTGKSGIPLTLKLKEPLPPEVCVKNQILGPSYPIWTITGPAWFETVRHKVLSDTGQYWEAKLQYGYCEYDEFGVTWWYPVADFLCAFESEGSASKVTITLAKWYSHPYGGDADAYFFDPSSRKPKPIITNCSTKEGTAVTIKSNPWEGFPNLKYWPEETLDAAYYLWYMRPDARKMVKDYMLPFLDDFGYKLATRTTFYSLNMDVPFGECFNSPLFSGDAFHSCDVWDKLPITEGAYPHFSTICVKALGLDARIWGIYAANCADYDSPSFLYPRIMFLLKHKGPKYKEKVCCFWDPTITVQNSAEDYLINGWKSIHVYLDFTLGIVPKVSVEVVDRPPLIDSIKDASTWTEGGSFPALVVLLSTLGWGFNYPEAQDAVDKYMDWFIKQQWGYPFNPGEEGYGRAEGYGKIWRPDLTGGFFIRGKEMTESDKTYRMSIHWTEEVPKHQLILNVMQWKPPEIPSPPNCYVANEYGGVISALALRVYDAYKFRLGGS